MGTAFRNRFYHRLKTVRSHRRIVTPLGVDRQDMAASEFQLRRSGHFPMHAISTMDRVLRVRVSLRARPIGIKAFGQQAQSASLVPDPFSSRQVCPSRKNNFSEFSGRRGLGSMSRARSSPGLSMRGTCTRRTTRVDHGEIVGSDIFPEPEPVDEMLHRPQAIQ